MFRKETYEDRRKRLKKEIDGGICIFLGNALVGMNYADNEYGFRQDSSFLYFWGLDYPGLAAVLDTDTGDEIIFGNELTIDDIVWTGKIPTLKDNAGLVGVTDTRSMSALKP